ncbi:copper chaperone PCu(A)C [Streptomyces macrosporus]|uniref:copper chaperone PCu(A)C n=1 Tax=Streptomyces macrosporus TaxID=44032 RepID=UPI0031D0041F
MRIRRRVLGLLLAAILAASAAGCGGGGDGEVDSPGTNARIGPVLVRYAHLAEPSDGPWETGSDVPLYVWLFNQRSPADRLVSAESPAADSITIVDADGEVIRTGVELPPEKLVELEKDRTHLVLRDVRQEIRGGDFVWVTLHFERAGSLSLQVPSQPPTYDKESPPPPLPTLTTWPEP